MGHPKLSSRQCHCLSKHQNNGETSRLINFLVGGKYVWDWCEGVELAGGQEKQLVFEPPRCLFFSATPSKEEAVTELGVE